MSRVSQRIAELEREKESHQTRVNVIDAVLVELRRIDVEKPKVHMKRRAKIRAKRAEPMTAPATEKKTLPMFAAEALKQGAKTVREIAEAIISAGYKNRSGQTSIRRVKSSLGAMFYDDAQLENPRFKRVDSGIYQLA